MFSSHHPVLKWSQATLVAVNWVLPLLWLPQNNQNVNLSFTPKPSRIRCLRGVKVWEQLWAWYSWLTWAHFTTSIWVQQAVFTDGCHKICMMRVLESLLGVGHLAHPSGGPMTGLGRTEMEEIHLVLCPKSPSISRMIYCCLVMAMLIRILKSFSTVLHRIFLFLLYKNIKQMFFDSFWLIEELLWKRPGSYPLWWGDCLTALL